MISRCVAGLSLLAALSGAVVVATQPVNAAVSSNEPAANGVTVAEAWARASAGAATTGAAYFMLKGGAQPDQLIAASTPAAAMAEVHETINDNGVMKMRSVAAIPVGANQTVTLAPGGIHIMLTGLKKPLTAGQDFPLTLTFAHAAPVTVEVTVRGLGSGAASGHDKMHKQ